MGESEQDRERLKQELAALRANVAPLVEAAEALVNMIEHSMTGMVHPEKGRFIKGVTDLDITPDGSVKLSHAREALAPFQQEAK